MSLILQVFGGLSLAIWCASGAYFSFLVLAGIKNYSLPLLIISGPIGWMTAIYIKTRNLTYTILVYAAATVIVLLYLNIKL